MKSCDPEMQTGLRVQIEQFKGFILGSLWTLGALQLPRNASFSGTQLYRASIIWAEHLSMCFRKANFSSCCAI